MSARIVVFDIGGVLIDWNPVYLYKKMLPDDASVAQFLTEVCNGAWNEQFDAGTPFAEGIAELAERHPAQADLIEAYWHRWHEMLGGEIPGTAKILERLKIADVPVHAISNWSAETFPRALERFPFLDAFDILVVSGREKMVKPGREIFDLFLQRAGVPAGDCLFIDDNPANIATATALGFQTELFRSAEALELRLVDMGLLTENERVNA
ncbi:MULTISPECIES: HAD family hydrolase [unclassified Rhizobium]|uniref:HAD family hydrolase n=1 Tax=unclassified Rhizobium TaxID=2613769 RepID=UPI0007132AD7|nr:MULTISPECIES: HAD family phosphatase [unclassified Rhizobium]KQS83268.1 HAD family hydrolase [Rhizobium sp. Leaf386]KQS89118.1 HAD family hydrolase [Rhizobium sp. Leaf391]KQT92967.1 HAD family hydrolase [Rhizobium sp. Leaf453]